MKILLHRHPLRRGISGMYDEMKQVLWTIQHKAAWEVLENLTFWLQTRTTSFAKCFPIPNSYPLWMGVDAACSRNSKNSLDRWLTTFCPVYRTYSLIESRQELGVTISTPNSQQAAFYLQYDDDGNIVFIEYLEDSR